MILNISKQKMLVIVSAIVIFFSFGVLSVKAEELTCSYALESGSRLIVNIKDGELTATIDGVGQINNNELTILNFQDRRSRLFCRDHVFFKSTSSGRIGDYKQYNIAAIQLAGYTQSTSQGDSISCDSFKIITQPMWMLIRIAAPIMLLVLGALDFAKATAASDEKMMKKSVQTFFKRTIITVAIFLLPTIVNLIVGWTVYDNLTGCL